MDTSKQATVTFRDKAASVVVVQRRQQWSVAEKRRMVEETLVPGASVARVARAAIVVLNHAYLEDFLRTLGRELLPERDETALDEIPLAKSSGRKEKFYLGSLSQFRGYMVDDLIDQPVAECLDKRSFSSAGEIIVFLERLGIKLNANAKKSLLHTCDGRCLLRGQPRSGNVDAVEVRFSSCVQYGLVGLLRSQGDTQGEGYRYADSDVHTPCERCASGDWLRLSTTDW